MFGFSWKLSGKKSSNFLEKKTNKLTATTITLAFLLHKTPAKRTSTFFNRFVGGITGPKVRYFSSWKSFLRWDGDDAIYLVNFVKKLWIFLCGCNKRLGFKQTYFLKKNKQKKQNKRKQMLHTWRNQQPQVIFFHWIETCWFLLL